VFIEQKASPKEWQIWMESRFDAGEMRSIDLDRVSLIEEEYAR
jgi:hypothetical protein